MKVLNLGGNPVSICSFKWISCHSSLCSRINVASSRPKREFKPKPVITTTLETGDNQQHNGIAYSSSIKSSGKPVATELTFWRLFYQIIACCIACTMGMIDSWVICIQVFDSSLFPRSGNGIVKPGFLSTVFYHPNLKCGTLLGFLGSLYCH